LASAALHLQKRGRDVVLIDRHELAGDEFRNHRADRMPSVFPYMFPRDFREILRCAMNRAPQVHYQSSDLPSFLTWLVRYFLVRTGAGPPQCNGRHAVDPSQPHRA